MANERYDYIVLDCVNGLWDDVRWMSWEVPNHFFNQYEKNDDIYIELHSCNFSGLISQSNIFETNASIKIDGVGLDNQNNTFGDKILSLIHGEIVVDGSNKYFSPVETLGMKVKANKFNNIKLCLEHQNSFLDFQSATDGLFVLKVSYKSFD